MKKQIIFARLLAGALVGASCAASAIDVTFEIVMQDGRSRSEQAALERKDGAVTFRLARAAIPEGVKYVKLKPDFARAKMGDEGYWVNSDGELGTFKARPKDAVRVSKRPHMPFFGMKTPQETWVAIVKGMSWNYSLAVELKNGYYTLAPTFDRHLAEAKEDIEVEFRWLTGDDADYSGMAKAYRAWQLARKEVEPLTERVKKQPLLDYMVKWPEVRVRLAWKPVPSPVPEQTVKNEPPVRPVITFDRFKRIVDEFKAQGIGGAEFCLVGWNAGGHDGRWPQIFPVEPLLGGEAKLKESVAWAQTNGYYVVAHCNHRDAYVIADSWDAEYIVEKNPDGSLKRGKTTWGGGRMYTICPQRAYERFASKDMPMVAAMGFRGLHYLDVFSCVPPPFCDDPRHPVNERDGARLRALHVVLQSARPVQVPRARGPLHPALRDRLQRHHPLEPVHHHRERHHQGTSERAQDGRVCGPSVLLLPRELPVDRPELDGRQGPRVLHGRTARGERGVDQARRGRLPRPRASPVPFH